MGDNTITPRQTTSGIAGVAANTTVTQQISRNNGCNIHVTPAPESAIGTVTYYYDVAKANATVDWLSRHFDFLNRHKGCSHNVPDYYLGYGDKYIRKFTDDLYPKLSATGKLWLIKARELLQEYMENGFKDNIKSPEVVVKSKTYKNCVFNINTIQTEALELENGRFRSFAFGTHPAAYIDGGLGNLPLKDLIEIGMTPDFKDLFSPDGLAQVKDILGYLIDQRLKELAQIPDIVVDKVERRTGEIARDLIRQGKQAIGNEIKRRLNRFFDIPFPQFF